MTIQEAINRLDSLKPNQYTQPEKIMWLSALDGRIKQEILDTHEGAQVEFVGYTEETPLSTQLLVTAPHESLYEYWLESQIDYANREFGSYNNSMAMFNSAYNGYWRYYNRTHKPKGAKISAFS